MDPRPPGRSLGLVETYGFVAAVEAADAMTKTARGSIARYEVTRGALVTILLRGELAEVEAPGAAGSAGAGAGGEGGCGGVGARHPAPAQPAGGHTADPPPRPRPRQQSQVAMILAKVLGTVVSTRKDAGLSGLKLLLAREVDGAFQPAGN